MESSRRLVLTANGLAALLGSLCLLPMNLEWLLSLMMGAVAFFSVLHLRFRWATSPAAAKKIVWLTAIWLGWNLFSAILSPSPGFATLEAVRLGCLALGGMACGAMTTKNAFKLWTLTAAVCLAAVAIYAMLRFGTLSKAASPPFFPDTNFLSAAIALVLFPLTTLLTKRNWGLMPVLALLTLLVTAIVVLRSRGAWLSIAGMLALIPLFYLRTPQLRRIWLLIVVLGTTALFAYRLAKPAEVPTTADRLSQLKSIGEIGQDFSNRERLMRWECAWRIALDHPLLGVGPGEYPHVFRLYLRGWNEADRISYWFGWRLGAHSDSLTTLAETGFPGAVAFLGMLLAVGRLAVRNQRQQANGLTWERGILLSLTGWAIHGCFNDLLSNGCLTIWAFWLVGAMLANTEQIAPQSNAPPS